MQEMDAVLRDAALLVAQEAIRSGRYVEPDLSALDPIAETFYKRVITEGWKSAQAEAKELPGPMKHRLAEMPKAGVKPLRFLVDLFSDKKTWGTILRRKQFLVDRLRRGYLRKLKQRFNEVVPRLLTGKASPEEVKSELAKTWEASRARVENIFRTETTKYFTETQLSYFNGEPGIIGYLFDSGRDSGRSGWCKSRHGLIYRPGTALLRENKPPCHWNCRSHLVPLVDTEHNRRMLEDPERDPEKRQVVPLPASWNR